jgi:hypothetical protein
VAVNRPDPRSGRRFDTLPSLTAVVRRAATGASSPAARAVPLWRLVRWPALLTLAVTLLRLAGERLGWSTEWFSPLPGGGLAPVGIVWLVPFVGAWFGFRLQRLGLRPPPLGIGLGVPLVSLALAPALPWLVNRVHETSWTLHLVAWAITSAFVAVLAVAAWPPLGRLLLVYALAARLPVLLVMAAAMWRRWGTHYDVVPPSFPAMPVLARWLWIGLLPQATIWVALTVAVGAVFGVLGWLAASRVPR